MDGADEGVGLGGEHGEAAAVFGRVFPNSSHPEPFVFGAAEKVGLLVAFGAGPFVVGGDGDEAAALFDGFAPHVAFEIIAAGVVDHAESFALEAPAHGDEFARGENDRGLVSAADQFGGIANVEPDLVGLFGGVEGVAHRWSSILEPAEVAGDGVGEEVIVLGRSSSDIVEDQRGAAGAFLV